jgi:Ca2+-binding EF-hand superfamily protein
VAVLGELLARIASAYMRRANNKSRKGFMSRSLTFSDLKTMDVNHNGQVDKAEFITYMLVALQKVSKEELDELSTMFHRLDKTHEGFLSKRDLLERGFEGSIRKSIAKMNVVPLDDNGFD